MRKGKMIMRAPRFKRSITLRLATATIGVVALTTATAAQTAAATSKPHAKQHQTAPRPVLTRQVKSLLAASARARATGEPVTIASMTTATSSTLAKPTGGFTTKTNVYPVRVKTASGWRPVSAKFLPSRAGGWSTAATPAALSISGGGAAPVIALKNSDGARLALTFPLPLPRPSVLGSVATYRSVLPGADLVVTASKLGGVTLTVVARTMPGERQALRAFAFGLNSRAIRVSATSGGNINATSLSGAAEFSASPAEISNEVIAHRASGRPVYKGRSEALVPVVKGSKLTFKPVSALPASPFRPVRIRISLAPAFSATHDTAQSGTATFGSTEVKSACPNTSFSAQSDPYGRGVGWQHFMQDCDGNSNTLYRAYYAIDLTNLDPAMKVQNATLQSWENFGADLNCADKTTVTLHWTGAISSATTWANQPSISANDQPQNTTLTNVKPGPNGNSTCNQQQLNFNVTYVISQAAAAGWNTWTFGMFGNECTSCTNLGFMRIGYNPNILTQFDVVPNTPSATREDPAPIATYNGSPVYGCNTTGQFGWITSTSVSLQETLQSNISGENVAGIFNVTDDNAVDKSSNSWSTSSAFIASGERTNTPAAPTGRSILNGHQYTWTSQATVSDNSNDGQNGNPSSYQSDPSLACTFAVDTLAPATPSVSSTAFPPAGSGLPSSPAGSSGTFQLSSTDPVPTGTSCSPSPCLSSGLAGFLYSLNTPIPTSGGTFIAANSSGMASLPLTIGNWGTNTLHVEAVDNADNTTQSFDYSFYAPWDPTKAVIPGDITGDTIPDLLATTNSDLYLLPGNTDPSIMPQDAAAETASPDGMAWSGFQITHRGSFQQQNVDDLFAHKGANIYVIENNPTNRGVAPQFANSGSNETIIATHPTCSASQRTGNCTGYDIGATWTTVSDIVAPGDAWTGAPACVDGPAITCDTGYPSLIMADSGELWLYQGTSANHLADPVLLGKIATNGQSWGNLTLVAPGIVGGVLSLWVVDNVTGIVYSYPITLASDGIPTINPSGATAPVTMDSGASMPNVLFQQDNWTSVTSPGPLNNSTFPGLYAETTIGTAPSGGSCAKGCLYFYPGESTAGGASPLQTNPIFVGVMNKAAAEIS